MSEDVYDGEFVPAVPINPGAAFGLWIVTEDGFLTLSIGGHEVMEVPDTDQGARALLRDMESIREQLAEASIALANRVIERSGGEGS